MTNRNKTLVILQLCEAPMSTTVVYLVYEYVRKNNVEFARSQNKFRSLPYGLHWVLQLFMLPSQQCDCVKIFLVLSV